MNHRRCRCRTGSATLFFGLPDQLANVIPFFGRNALRDGGQRELFVLAPNDIGLRLPLDVLLVCGLRPCVTPLLGPPRFADQLLADQRDDLDRDRDIASALIFVRKAAEGLVVAFDDGEKPGESSLGHLRRLSNWATVRPKGRTSGQPICSGMPSCATSSHVTDLFAVDPSGLPVIVHLTRVNRSTRPCRSAAHQHGWLGRCRKAPSDRNAAPPCAYQHGPGSSPPPAPAALSSAHG